MIKKTFCFFVKLVGAGFLITLAWGLWQVLALALTLTSPVKHEWAMLVSALLVLTPAVAFFVRDSRKPKSSAAPLQA